MNLFIPQSFFEIYPKQQSLILLKAKTLMK